MLTSIFLQKKEVFDKLFKIILKTQRTTLIAHLGMIMVKNIFICSAFVKGNYCILINQGWSPRVVSYQACDEGSNIDSDQTNGQEDDENGE